MEALKEFLSQLLHKLLGEKDKNLTSGCKSRGYTLQVFSPTTKGPKGRQYTEYCISMQTSSAAFRLNKSQTKRRFSEFQWLRKELNKVDSWITPPPLPFSKRFWNLFDPVFVESRRHRLEQWIHRVLAEPLYLSNSSLHLFLQTEMSVSAIQDYLDGQVTEQMMDEIWGNHGKLYQYQAHNLLHNDFREEPTEIYHSEDEDSEKKELLHVIAQKSPTPSYEVIQKSDPTHFIAQKSPTPSYEVIQKSDPTHFIAQKSPTPSYEVIQKSDPTHFIASKRSTPSYHSGDEVVQKSDLTHFIASKYSSPYHSGDEVIQKTDLEHFIASKCSTPSYHSGDEFVQKSDPTNFIASNSSYHSLYTSTIPPKTVNDCDSPLR